MSLAAVAAALTPGGATAARIGVFARMPPPGYPASAVYGPDGLVYAGSFKPLAGGTPGVPSKVFAFGPAGQVVRAYTVLGQSRAAVDGVQVATVDRQGRLYLLDQDPARVLVLDPRTGAQSTWATIPALPGAASPEPDFAAWGPDGSLYVTDYAQYVVWKVPPSGGVGRVWLSDPRLNGTIVGPAGIELMADRRTLLLSAGGGGADPLTGKLYEVPVQQDGSAGPVRQIWESNLAEAPDGFAIARSGNVYLSLVGPLANAIVEISPAGRTIARFPANPVANTTLAIPFDAPGSVTFDGRQILVGNQSAILQNSAHMALLSVDVGEPGLGPSLPPASAAAVLPRLRLTVSPSRVRARRKVRLSVTVTAAGQAGHRIPVAGALVGLRGHQARTGRDGRAVLAVTFTVAGRRTVAARAPGYARATATVAVSG